MVTMKSVFLKKFGRLIQDSVNGWSKVLMNLVSSFHENIQNWNGESKRCYEVKEKKVELTTLDGSIAEKVVELKKLKWRHFQVFLLL
jgi:hypothetical protein